MKIQINIFSKLDDNKFVNINKLEILMNSLTAEEENLLRNYSVYYEKIFNNKVIIHISDFIHYNVEIDENNSGIYLEDTKNYNEVLNEDSYNILEIKNYLNLVISKEGVKLEILLLKNRREI